MFTPEQEILMDRELGARSFRDFIDLAWPLVEPAQPFAANYHHDAFAEHLEAVTRRDILRLCVNVPPGTSKSIVFSVLWPVWTWILNPSEKWITASYSDRIARRDSLRSRQILESKWFRERWGHTWEKNPDSWTGTEYRNSEGGFRFAVTVGGGVTGEHATRQLVDDPIKPLDARGARVDSVRLQVCKEWWDETMATRVVDPATTTRTIIMQRLHEADLSAHVLNSGDYTHLNLPMRYERKCVIKIDHPCSLPAAERAGSEEGLILPPTPIGYKDPRKEGGELLWPERFTEAVLETRQKELGSRGVAAQDQQRPVPAGGGIFKRDWCQFWRAMPKGPGTQLIQSWDCAFKKLTDSDFVVGQVWARKDGCYYLIDQVRDRMTVSGTCKAVATLSAKWPRATKKLIEDKANGPAVIDLLSKKIPGLLPINPKGGKISRAYAAEPIWESGNVWLPDPERAPWIHDFIEEVVSFNGDEGREDDQVDAMTQALAELYVSSVSSYLESLKRGRT